MQRLLTIAILLIPSVCCAAPWQNPANHLDVNNSNTVSPNDLLIVVNRLLTHGPGPIPTDGSSPPPYYDVNGDDFITPIDFLQIGNYLNFGGGSVPAPADTARLSLVVTDLLGVPIATIGAGEQFNLSVYVEDTRSSPLGAYAAYAALHFDGALVSQASPPSLTPGLIASAGGFHLSASPHGPGIQHMGAWLMQADAPGTVQFVPTPGVSPLDDLLLWGVDAAIPQAQIEFQGATLTIVPEPGTYALAAIGVLGLLVFWRRHTFQCTGRNLAWN